MTNFLLLLTRRTIRLGLVLLAIAKLGSRRTCETKETRKIVKHSGIAAPAYLDRSSPARGRDESDSVIITPR
jgi:hypothetical protein